MATPAPDPALAAEQGKQAGLARLAAPAALADALPPAAARVRIPESCLLRTPWPLRAG
ncbi:MAG TPA: hypothetical protein VFN75_03000 [Pseudonocardiaceae bacterium]|nr:hypothetical protein [Pseudonocardiaceae bacterium]